VAKRPRRCDPGEVWPPSGWSPVAKMPGRRPGRAALSASSVRRADICPLGQADVRCPRVRCPCVRCHPGVRTDGPPVSAALPPRCPDRAGPWNGSVRRHGPRAAWSPARTGPDGKRWCCGGPHEGQRQPRAAASHAHRLRRRLGVWPTRKLVQRQGAGRLAGSTRIPRCSPVPQVRPGQVPAWCPTVGWTGRWSPRCGVVGLVMVVCGRFRRAHPVRR
jgi:hypothetical protein